MIALDGLAARRAPLSLSDISLSWGAGAHALVGAYSDGGALLLALIAGAARFRAGRARVLDGAPSEARVRRRIAFVPLQPRLPDALRVDETLRLASVLRREEQQDPTARLRVLGVEALAPRLSRTLSLEEARAVALVEATTSTSVRVLLVEEPLVALDARATARLPEVLRARAQNGCAMIVATASVRDAAELADDYLMLRHGAIVGRASSPEGLVGFSQAGIRLRIVVDSPRALLAALGREGAVEALARNETGLVVRGRDALDLARAAGRAIVASGVEVTEMRFEVPALEEARNALAAVASEGRGTARGARRQGEEPLPAAPAAGMETP